MRFTGHLDLHRAWIRVFRRAKLPLAYTQGFHPQPRLNLACALPLGFTSQCEVIDAWLDDEIPLEQIKNAILNAVPPGIHISDMETVDLWLPALQTQVLAAEYQITFLDPVPDLAQRIQRLLESSSLPRERNNRRYDLRLLVESIELLPESITGLPQIIARLAAREGATGRPEELIAALNLEMIGVQVHRVRLFFS